MQQSGNKKVTWALTALLGSTSLLFSAACGFFDEEEDAAAGYYEYCWDEHARDHFWRKGPCHWDAGVWPPIGGWDVGTTCDGAVEDSGRRSDAGTHDTGINDINDGGVNDARVNDARVNDAGGNDADLNDAGTHDGADASSACSTTPDCPRGNACIGSVCQPCSGGVCTCRRDTDCPADDICNHGVGRCEAPPVFCEDLQQEAACLQESGCRPIYSGVNCVDALGGDCTREDPDCTCERFEFALCATAPADG